WPAAKTVADKLTPWDRDAEVDFDDQAGQHAGHRIGRVVVLTGRMIDRIPAPAGDTPLQTAELCDQVLVIEKLGTAAIQDRQQVPIQVGFRSRCWLTADTVRGETFGWPHPGVAITEDGADVVALQKVGKVAADRLWAERWLHLADRIQNGVVTVA